MKPGTPVKILIKAGAVERGTAGIATKTIGEIAPGQLGLYQRALPETGPEWHVVSVGAWDVALHASHFVEARS
jgi:hypothetical protein